MNSLVGCLARDDPKHVGVPTPIHNKHDGSREIKHLPGLPIHEVFADELASEPATCESSLAKLQADHLLPPCYYDCPVVGRWGNRMYPCVFYFDGIAFARKDSVFAFFACGFVSGKQHCVFVLRKAEMGTCGWKGWRTRYLVFVFLRWAIDASSTGLFPDGCPFSDLGDDPLDMPGFSFGRCVLLHFLNGDRSEFQVMLGFPTFASNCHPCPLCRVSRDAMSDFNGFTVSGRPFAEITYVDYELACAVCEFVVMLIASQHAYLLPRLGHDRRGRGGHGRCLLVDIPVAITGVELLKGNRLEPFMDLFDVGGVFDRLRNFPIRIVVWRVAKESLTHHRNPIWNPEIGFTRDQVFALDNLYTSSLGVIVSVVAMIIVHLGIRMDAGEAKETIEDARFAMSVMRIWAELTHHHDDLKRQGIRPPEVQELMPGMFGKGTAQTFTLKASESTWFLPCTRKLIIKHGRLFLDAPNLLVACDALLKCVELARAYPVSLPLAVAQDCRPGKCVLEVRNRR